MNSPRDFPTTQSFVTAQEELEPVPSGMEDADIDEVSSPNWKPIGRNTKRQVIQLHTGQYTSPKLACHRILLELFDRQSCVQMLCSSKRARLFT